MEDEDQDAEDKEQEREQDFGDNPLISRQHRTTSRAVTYP